MRVSVLVKLLYLRHDYGLDIEDSITTYDLACAVYDELGGHSSSVLTSR